MKLIERAQRIQCGLASNDDLKDLSREDMVAIKGDRSEMHYRFVGGTHKVEATKAVGDEKAQKFRHVASDESVDSMGDIILVAGWGLDRFKSNPQLLWAHDQRSLPIGNVSNVWKGKTNGAKALMTDSVFHDADTNAHADAVRKLVEAGALPGVSVGFIPKAFTYPKSDEERTKLGLGEWGVLHQEQELLELSVVPVPANKNALRKKMVDAGREIFGKAEEFGWDPEMVQHLERALNFTTDEELINRRRIFAMKSVAVTRESVEQGGFVPDEYHDTIDSLAEAPPEQRQKTVVETPPGEEPSADSRELPERTLVALDQESRSAIEKLTACVDTLVANLTKAEAVATGAGDELDEPSQDPDARGEDNFMERVAEQARIALLGSSEQN